MKFNTSPDFVSDVPVSQLEKSKRCHEIWRNIRYFKAIGGRNFRREIKTPGDSLDTFRKYQGGNKPILDHRRIKFEIYDFFRANRTYQEYSTFFNPRMKIFPFSHFSCRVPERLI